MLSMNSRLRFILISNTIFVFAGSLFAPLYAIFVLSLDGSAAIAGLLVAVQFFVSFIVGIFVIRLKDKVYLSQLLLKTNFLIRGVLWLLLALFPSIEMLFFCQILNGTAEAIGSPSFNSLVSDNLDNKKHIKEWGFWELVKNPAISIASLIGGFVVTVFGFSALFAIMSSLAFVSFFVYQFTLKNEETIRIK